MIGYDFGEIIEEIVVWIEEVNKWLCVIKLDVFLIVYGVVMENFIDV